MSALFKLNNAIKAFFQLGPQPVVLNIFYRLGLELGWYSRKTKREAENGQHTLQPLFTLPDRGDLKEVLGSEGRKSLLDEADEIVKGKVRLFGDKPVDLRLTLPGTLEHWTIYEKNTALLEPFFEEVSDVKYLWEPARFGWAYSLGRAYFLSHVGKYAEAFWRFTETFLEANPPYLGPQWMSGQEVALRLMALVWSIQVFADAPSSTPDRLSRLTTAIADHARRIPPTLIYARSQGNNHLLTEAAGLLTAGLALPGHPNAKQWKTLGSQVVNDALQSQIDSYGEYTQHSTNYQRLMLQTALWVNAFIPAGRQFTPASRKKLAAATHWMLSVMDAGTGRVPNLGANDGAYILPWTVCPFSDFRPLVHAAARTFLDYDLPHGPWDEMALWFNIPVKSSRSLKLPRYLGDNLYGQNSWAVLRTAQFKSRPSHADQLNLDLWWRGLNVAMDPGTYLYNASSPWENSLTTALVHNTLTVNGKDQMTRAGRFLYLDWVDAYRIRSAESADSMQNVSGRYRVFRRDGYRHTRCVDVFTGDRWLVRDEVVLMPFPFAVQTAKPFSVRLHWLLPDWKWELKEFGQEFSVRLKSPHGWVTVTICQESPQGNGPLRVSLARAGEVVHGSASEEPIRGWVSPTYGVKIPALSLDVIAISRNPVQFTSEFLFP